MAKKIRRQVSLFVKEKDAETIEAIRKAYNPRQSELIKCHVTLCREDEIEDLEQVVKNLASLQPIELTIEFGEVIRFAEGKGVLIEAKGDHTIFQNLRKLVLHGLTDKPRMHKPHITLMHPKNSTCTNKIFSHIKKINLPTELTFNKISLIEQDEGGPWKIIQEFKINQSSS